MQCVGFAVVIFKFHSYMFHEQALQWATADKQKRAKTWQHAMLGRQGV